MKVAYLGYGDLGIQIRTWLNEFESIEEEIAFDDKSKDSSLSVLPFDLFIEDTYRDFIFYVCLGYHHLEEKIKICESLLEANREIGSFVHPSSFVHKSARLQQGVYIYPGCTIDMNVVVGAGSFLNNGVILSHNCTIGNCNYISPGVTISGNVSIGNANFIGAGSVIRDSVNIGSSCFIGMNSSVTRDIPDSTSCVGNPLRILKNPIKL